MIEYHMNSYCWAVVEQYTDIHEEDSDIGPIRKGKREMILYSFRTSEEFDSFFSGLSERAQKENFFYQVKATHFTNEILKRKSDELEFYRKRAEDVRIFEKEEEEKQSIFKRARGRPPKK